jgi:hypothetical protein
MALPTPAAVSAAGTDIAATNVMTSQRLTVSRDERPLALQCNMRKIGAFV